ncbi:MAG: CotH kinase family protein [Saprospiraceae bacterium]
MELRNLRFILFIFVCYIPLLVPGQVDFKSSNLPILLINTNGASIPNEPKIAGDLEIIYNGPGKINKLTDAGREFKGKIGVELHGSSSLDLSPKKPLGIETRMDDGITNLNVSLLGLPKENDWILLAPYSDKSLIRDILIHRIASEMMPYSPRTRLCELLVNGQYAGVYVLMEKIKQDKNRVNIPELTTSTNSGDALTGGYILKIDKSTGSTPQGGFNSKYSNISGPVPNYTNYKYEEPEANVITTDQKNYISTLVNNFEASFFSADFTNPVNGFRKYADEKSMIDFLLLNEIANNVDGYRLSTYIYKDVDSKSAKLKFGPVWDYNLGFGNADYCQGGEYTGLAFEFNNRCPNDYWLVPFYWTKVMTDPTFFSAAKTRWAQLRKNTLLENNLIKIIDSLTQSVQEAQIRNFTKWNILNNYVWPNRYVGGSYEAEINYLKTWLRNRIKFLDGYFGYSPSVAVKIIRQIEIKLYPNPAENFIQIEFPASFQKNVEARIYNAFGMEVLNRLLNLNRSLPIHELPPGLYYLKLSDGQRPLATRSFSKY